MYVCVFLSLSPSAVMATVHLVSRCVGEPSAAATISVLLPVTVVGRRGGGEGGEGGRGGGREGGRGEGVRGGREEGREGGREGRGSICCCLPQGSVIPVS